MFEEKRDLEVRTPISIQQKMTVMERGVYSALKEYMSWNDYTCYPSMATLADKLGCSTNTVRKYLRSLEKKGIITITYRVETHKKTKHKYNKSNLYTFIAEQVLKKGSRVLQNKKQATQHKEDKQALPKELNDVNDSPEKVKLELEERFGRVVVEKALQQLSIVTSKGTVVNHLRNYLDKICRGIQAQLNIINGINQVDKTGSLKQNLGAKKNYPAPNKLKGGWGSSSINRVSNKYSNDELEAKMLAKRLEYSVLK